jgi:hypothetical protein
LKQLQLIQILSINAQTLVEPLFARTDGPRINSRSAPARHEKGGVRIAEAAFEAGKSVVLACPRFTAR